MLTRAEIPGLIVTALLVSVGVLLVVWHWRSWKRIENDPEEGTETRWSQVRRRIQVAVMIALAGGLLCIGDTVLPILHRGGWLSQQRMAVWWTVDVILLLFLAVWIALMALGDMALTISRTRVDQLRLRQKQRELAAEIERYREQHGDPP
jgi:hypothetical protein